MTAVALAAAPADVDGGVASRLEALLDPEFLAEAGWDPQTMVLSTSAEHPTLGWAVCRVGDCGAMAEGAKGLCPGCTTRMARDGGERPPAMCGKTYRPGVGRCAMGCDRPWESRRRPLCDAHDYQQRVVLGVSVEVFLASPDVVALPGFGPCAVLACTRLRHSRLCSLCKAHQRRWGQAHARDPQLVHERWCHTEPAIAAGGEISLRGLSRGVSPSCSTVCSSATERGSRRIGRSCGRCVTSCAALRSPRSASCPSRCAASAGTYCARW